MAQKKAFVRYANNKAVPGSLIVRTKAPKVGTWKEVPYDVCCGSGGNCCDSLGPLTWTTEPGAIFGTGSIFNLILNCFGNNYNTYGMITATLSTPITTPPTISEVVDLINEYFSDKGITAVLDGDVALVTVTNSNFFSCGCINLDSNNRRVDVVINDPA